MNLISLLIDLAIAPIPRRISVKEYQAELRRLVAIIDGHPAPFVKRSTDVATSLALYGIGLR